MGCSIKSEQSDLYMPIPEQPPELDDFDEMVDFDEEEEMEALEEEEEEELEEDDEYDEYENEDWMDDKNELNFITFVNTSSVPFFFSKQKQDIAFLWLICLMACYISLSIHQISTRCKIIGICGFGSLTKCIQIWKKHHTLCI